jgi:hypothetical protein
VAKPKVKGKVTKANAYWISPDGFVIPVGTKHIDVILKNPEKFDVTEQYLRKIYKKHKEPYGHEGYAREDIMSSLIKIGWVRLRYNPKQDSWTAQVVDIPKSAGPLTSWGYAVKKLFPWSEVVVMDLQPDILWSGDVTSLADGDYEQEGKKVYHSPLAAYLESLTFLESIDEYRMEKSIIDELGEKIPD